MHGFNWVATGVEIIATKNSAIPCPHYFDNATFIAPSTLCQELIEIVAEGWLILVGRSRRGQGRTPPPNFGFWGSCSIRSMSSPQRTVAINKSIAEVLNAVKTAGVAAERIRGKLAHTKAQIFGRIRAMAMHLLKHVTLLGSQETRLDKATRFASSFRHDFLKDYILRTTPLSSHCKRLV